MGHTDNSKASPTAVKSANNTWEKFMFFSKICGGAICITLILMALFLV
jgi:hypothetical protein